MLLEMKKINAGYGKKHVIFNISVYVKRGEIVSIIGPNGSGKSTVLKVAAGMLPAQNGSVILEGENVTGRPASKNVQNGVVYSPQGHLVFKNLSVMENLKIGGLYLPKKDVPGMIGRVLMFFPELQKRLKQKAAFLSGGEQQMLALARALVGRPKLLLLDEPSLGLSPKSLEDAFQMISRAAETYNVSILIVEQQVKRVLDLSDRVYGLSLGKIIHEGSSQILKEDSEALARIFLSNEGFGEAVE